MNTKKIKIYTIILLICMNVLIFSQQKLNSKEKYFFNNQISGKIIRIKDTRIGFLEDNLSILNTVNNFIQNGLVEESCAEGMFSILKNRYEQIKRYKNYRLRLSRKDMNEKKYSGYIRLISKNGLDSKTGIIYLIRENNNWVIEDWLIN